MTERRTCKTCGHFDPERVCVDGRLGCCCCESPGVFASAGSAPPVPGYWSSAPFCVQGWPHTEPGLWCGEHTELLACDLHRNAGKTDA